MKRFNNLKIILTINNDCRSNQNQQLNKHENDYNKFNEIFKANISPPYSWNILISFS